MDNVTTTKPIHPSIHPPGDILSRLVKWIYNSDFCLDPPQNGTGQVTATQQLPSPSEYFVHESLCLDIQEINVSDRIRVLRNKGTAIPRGTSVMCIPTISTTLFRSESSPPINKSEYSDGDSQSREVYELAWYLSQKPNIIHPYIDSLPASNSDLPRIWPEHTLQLLLAGSPVLIYIQDIRQRVQSYFQRSKERKNDTENRLSNDKNLSSPTWVDYSYSHAMVTSRAFSCDVPLTNNQTDKQASSSECAVVSLHMVPVLDLCDHCRGLIEGTNDERLKNVSYTFRTCHDHAMGKNDATARVVVDVVATQDIKHNESIRITYGAKPNSVLLVNYGFTIPNNIEPDGSSNDILEFYATTVPNSSSAKINDGSPITILRTGPPSYTYGCFTTALQCFLTTAIPNTSIHESSCIDRDDEMEQFLNDCDDEEQLAGYGYGDDKDTMCDDGDDDNDDFEADASDGELKDSDSSRRDLSTEIKALRDFRKHLLQLADTYNLPKHTTMDWANFIPSEAKSDSRTTKEQVRQLYAANLIYSEIRIIQFYVWATEQLECRLSDIHAEMDHVDVSKLSRSLLKVSFEDVQLLNKQVNELATSYVKLRHS